MQCSTRQGMTIHLGEMVTHPDDSVSMFKSLGSMMAESQETMMETQQEGIDAKVERGSPNEEEADHIMNIRSNDEMRISRNRIAKKINILPYSIHRHNQKCNKREGRQGKGRSEKDSRTSGQTEQGKQEEMRMKQVKSSKWAEQKDNDKVMCKRNNSALKYLPVT